MDTMALLAAATVAGAIICGFLAYMQMMASPRDRLERRLGHIVGDQQDMQVMALGNEALRSSGQRSFQTIAAFLDRRNLTERIALDLQRADMRLSVSEFVALRLFLGMVAALVTMLIFGSDGIFNLLKIVGAGLVGYKLPVFKMKMAQGGRLKKINEQLLEALTMLSSSLRAGFGLMQGMDILARELTHPMSTEMRRFIQDINIGSSTEEALLNLSKRCGSPDVDIVVTAMIIQQQTGGNLAEILDNVNETMRERVRIRGEIKTLTTQQALSGWVIGLLPPVVGLFIFMINPEYMKPLYTETIGWALLGGAAFMEFVGVMIIKKIITIEV
jgi:tight adherence protein B